MISQGTGESSSQNAVVYKIILLRICKIWSWEKYLGRSVTAQSKKKFRERIGTLKTFNNGIAQFGDGPKEMAEILSARYKSVFMIPTVIP